MSNRAYCHYQSGLVVAALHLGLTVRQVCGDSARDATEIVLPRDDPKARMTLWLCALAAERKAAGRCDPLRRTRIRQRIRALVAALGGAGTGSPARRQERAKNLANQAQDRANFICSTQYRVIEQVAAALQHRSVLSGEDLRHLVCAARGNATTRPRRRS